MYLYCNTVSILAAGGDPAILHLLLHFATLTVLLLQWWHTSYTFNLIRVCVLARPAIQVWNSNITLQPRVFFSCLHYPCSTLLVTVDVRLFMTYMHAHCRHDGISIGLVGMSNTLVHVACHFCAETGFANPHTLFTFLLRCFLHLKWYY
jgi:hypothetical protein